MNPKKNEQFLTQLQHLKNYLPSLVLDNEVFDSLSTKACYEQYKQFYSLSWKQKVWSHTGMMECNGYKIFTQVWCPLKTHGSVFIVHGLLDHAGLYAHIIRFFLEHSYAVYIFDHPGHGLSSGDRIDIHHFSEYADVLSCGLSWARDKLPAPWVLLGQSMGGAVVTHSLIINNVHQCYPIEKVILLAPLVRTYRWFLLQMSSILMRPFTRCITAYSIQNSNDEDFLIFLKNDPLREKKVSMNWLRALCKWPSLIAAANKQVMLPVHVIQGEKDMAVDWRYNFAWLAKWYPNMETYLIKEAYHHLANESASIRQQYCSHLLTKLDVFY